MCWPKFLFVTWSVPVHIYNIYIICIYRDTFVVNVMPRHFYNGQHIWYIYTSYVDITIFMSCVVQMHPVIVIDLLEVLRDNIFVARPDNIGANNIQRQLMIGGMIAQGLTTRERLESNGVFDSLFGCVFDLEVWFSLCLILLFIFGLILPLSDCVFIFRFSLCLIVLLFYFSILPLFGFFFRFSLCLVLFLLLEFGVRMVQMAQILVDDLTNFEMDLDELKCGKSLILPREFF